MTTARTSNVIRRALHRFPPRKGKVAGPKRMSFRPDEQVWALAQELYEQLHDARRAVERAQEAVWALCERTAELRAQEQDRLDRFSKEGE